MTTYLILLKELEQLLLVLEALLYLKELVSEVLYNRHFIVSVFN